MKDLYQHLTLFLEEVKKKGETPLLVICGPTASGKTGLSLKLAKEFNGEVISADSAQVYRKMDIGTAKVTVDERAQVKHHLIDIRNPNQGFTMADFQKEAARAITDILKRGKLPIICGGTGLYISALTENYELQKAPPNPEIRAQLQKEYEEKGAEHLYQKLKELDPAAAAKIHPNNVRYVGRALEIVMQTEKPVATKVGKALYNVFKVGIEWDREVLYERINKRVDEQIEMGLLNEIKTLLAEGYSEKLQAFTALGYKEFFPYFHGDKSLEACKEELKQGTRNYAKRQLTWLRKQDDIYWINPHAS
jgi:tRNA dimethylallyltransferase